MVGLDRSTRSRGFTLIELLVCLSVATALICLLVPAIQASREAARRAQCRNHLRQLALATHMFHDSHSKLPPMEIADSWATWAVFLLPYLEQSGLYQQWQLDRRYHAQPASAGQDLPVFHCPSRPTASIPLLGTGGLFREGWVRGPLGWSDFGAVGGTSLRRNNGVFATAIDSSTNLPSAQIGSGSTTQSVMTQHPGWRLPLRFRDHALDGLSHTLAFGEMHVLPTPPLDSVFDGDNASAYQRCLGRDGPLHPVTQRYMVEFPIVDQPRFTGINWSNRFGSAHAGICHFALLDGSVRPFSVSTDLEVLHRLAARNDGLPVSLP